MITATSIPLRIAHTDGRATVLRPIPRRVLFPAQLITGPPRLEGWTVERKGDHMLRLQFHDVILWWGILGGDERTVDLELLQECAR